MKKLLLGIAAACLAGFTFAQDAPLWMRHSVISPDGTTIAFTYKGDIYTVPVTGGRAMQITTNPAYDTDPVWSPDSKQVAFASDRMGSLDVYIVSKDGGEPRRLTTHSGSETPLAFTDAGHILFSAGTEKPTDHADKDYSYRLFQNLYDYCRAQERKDDSVELKQLWKKHGIDNMRAAWEYVIKTNDRLIAWYENNLYYHYVGYLVSVGNQPLDIYNKLENAKQQFSGREWTNDDTEKEFHKLIMDSFKDKGNYLNAASIDGFEYGSKYVFRLLLLFNVETSRQKGQRFAFDSFKKEKWDIEHIDSQNNASLVEHEDRLRWLNNVAYILGIESKLNERKATAKPLYDKCMDFIPKYEANLRGTGIDKQYTDFCKEVLEYFSAGDGAIKNKDSIGNLTLLDYKTNREYQDAPFPYKRHCIIREDKAGKRFMPIGTRNVFLKYYSNSNTESSFIDAMRWSMPDFDGYLREIHNTVDVIFNVFNSNSTETYER